MTGPEFVAAARTLIPGEFISEALISDPDLHAHRDWVPGTGNLVGHAHRYASGHEFVDEDSPGDPWHNEVFAAQ